MKLWQICLAQCHSEFYWKHFGDLSVHRLVNNPLAAIAAASGVDMDLSDITPLQASLFDKDWIGSLDSLTASFQQQEPIMQKLENVRGAALWQHTLQMTDEAFEAPRSKWEKLTSRIYSLRVCIISRNFISLCVISRNLISRNIHIT